VAKAVIKQPPEKAAWHGSVRANPRATCSRCHGESSKDLTQFMNFSSLLSSPLRSSPHLSSLIFFLYGQSKIFDFVLPPLCFALHFS